MIADAVTQTFLNDHIHVAPQQLFKVHQEPSQVKKATTWLEVHQEIHIAARLSLAARRGYSIRSETRETLRNGPEGRFYVAHPNQQSRLLPLTEWARMKVFSEPGVLKATDKPMPCGPIGCPEK